MTYHTIEFQKKIEKLNKRDRLIELSKALKEAHLTQEEFEKYWGETK